MRIRSAAPTIAVLALLGCAPKAASLSAADVEANKAVSQRFAAAVIAKDFDAAAALYADSALLLPPNAPTLVGTAAIRGFLAGFPPLTELTLTVDGVVGTGDLAYAYGRYHLTVAAAGSPVDSGKFLDVRQRQKDGSWKYVADMFSSNIPAPAAP
jgi:ketosteroid isomerase-like protein